MEFSFPKRKASVSAKNLQGRNLTHETRILRGIGKTISCLFKCYQAIRRHFSDPENLKINSSSFEIGNMITVKRNPFLNRLQKFVT